MSIQNVFVLKNSSFLKSATAPVLKTSFKEVLQQKSMPSIKTVINNMVSNHEQAVSAVKSSLVRTDYTPEKLLGLQYKTGLLFLREQMFCKTAELSANTLKNFAQMQV